MDTSHLANHCLHDKFVSQQGEYWVCRAEKEMIIVPCLYKNIDRDLRAAFRSIDYNGTNLSVIIALGTYPHARLRLEGSSLFLGLGDSRFSSFSGTIKISDSFLALGRGISSNSTSLVFGGNTFSSLGMDVMIAQEVRIRNISGHAFLPIRASDASWENRGSKTYAGNLIVEPHVWFGERSSGFFPRDARVGLGSIVKYAGIASQSCEQLSQYDRLGQLSELTHLWSRSAKLRDIKMASLLFESRKDLANTDPCGMLRKEQSTVEKIAMSIISLQSLED